MIVFALLMITASVLMISNADEGKEQQTHARDLNNKTLSLAIWGFAIGIITGLLGAGGGFLIIPALVLFMKLPMKTAIGTSLVIIAINSIFGFLFSLKQTPLDWKILLLFTGLSIVGIYFGSRYAEKVSGKTLKKWFGSFVLIMGIYIIIKEIFFKS